MSSEARGVVVAHGAVAEALVGAAERISGVRGALRAVSNEGLGPAALAGAVEAARGEGAVILFPDVAGGSTGMACWRLAARDAEVACLAGVNLPMLLDFLLNRHLSPEELAARLVERGRRAVRAAPGAE